MARAITITEDAPNEGEALTDPRMTIEWCRQMVIGLIQTRGDVGTPVEVGDDYVMSAGDSFLNVTAGSAGILVTLPEPTSGKGVTIKKVDSGVGLVVIAGDGATIDGETSYTIETQWDFVVLRSDGENWFVISNN